MKRIFCTICLLLFTGAASAGNPWYVDNAANGVPMKWKNGQVKWVIDSGALSPSVSNEKAIEWMTELFGKWSAASDNKLKVAYAGKTSGDVDSTNYQQFIDKLNDGEAIIILDPDGSFPPSGMNADVYKNNIVGFSGPWGPFKPGETGSDITGGFIVLNGWFLNNDNPRRRSEEQFKAAIFHEMGHLLNVDHTAVNETLADKCRVASQCTAPEDVATMYPVLIAKEQLNLHKDDAVAVKALYGKDAVKAAYCTLEGELKDTNGSGVQGIYVVATNADPTKELSDSLSTMSGILYPPGTANGTFAIYGLEPGQNYKVSYIGLDARKYTSGSSIQPNDPPLSEEEVTTMLAGQEGSFTVECKTAGSVLTGKSVSLAPSPKASNIVGANVGANEPPEDTVDTDFAASGGKGCAFVPCAIGGVNISLVLTALAGLAISRRRRTN